MTDFKREDEWESATKKLCEADAREETLKAEVERYNKALQSLTPGGSEFYHAPERCAQWAKASAHVQHQLILKARHHERELEAEIERLKKDSERNKP